MDIALLQTIKHRSAYNKVKGYIPKSALDKRTIAIADDIGKFLTLHPDADVVEISAFKSLFFTSWHKNLKDADKEVYDKMLTNMMDEPLESVKKNIINMLLELDFATKCGNAIQDYTDGEDIDIVHTVSTLLTQAQGDMDRTKSFEFAAFDNCTLQEPAGLGLPWPLQAMNDVYEPITGGDQFIIAARPGRGKTSFLTFLCAGLAKHLPPNKVIVWFNNESRKEKIMARQIQSALGATRNQLKAMDIMQIRAEYMQSMGAPDRVRIFDVHGMSIYMLEEILESIGEDNVGAIIFDMLDNVRYPMKGEARTDEVLEKLYQWSRNMAIKYNCPSFPTSQISNEGDGLMFPPANMLKDSKTGKQGACDGIVMLGASNDPLMQTKRGLSMPKTKSKKEGQFDMLIEVNFLADIGRFT